MKKIIAILTLAFGVCCHMQVFAKTNEQPLDQIVAIINDDVITQSEYNHALATIKMQMAQENVPAPSAAALRKQVLNQLINKKLQLQMAKQVGVQTSNRELEAAIKNIATQNNVSVNELYQHVNDTGMSTKDYREEMRNQLAIHKLQQQEVVSRISISPSEISHFMQTQAWKNFSTKEYHLEDMLVPLSDAPSAEEIIAAKNHADELVAKLQQGEEFQTLARAEASKSNALQDGDLGWRKLTDIPSAFANQVERMQPMQTAGPIQTSNGFHIIHLIGVRAAAGTNASVNRKQVEDYLFERKFEEAMQTWVSKLRGQAFIVTDPNKINSALKA